MSTHAICIDLCICEHFGCFTKRRTAKAVSVDWKSQPTQDVGFNFSCLVSVFQRLTHLTSTHPTPTPTPYTLSIDYASARRRSFFNADAETHAQVCEDSQQLTSRFISLRSFWQRNNLKSKFLRNNLLKFLFLLRY